MLSDVAMPEMGSIKLLRSMRQLGLALPVVFITGHPMQEELQKLQTEEPIAWLLKLPRLRQLAQAINQVLSK
ncbi:MAG: hypothetical protein AB1894_11160 [Chloroflexota bacterium]